jgi:hypothetical protein
MSQEQTPLMKSMMVLGGVVEEEAKQARKKVRSESPEN